MTKYELYKLLIDQCGAQNQTNVAIEEMAELTKEIIKSKRGQENFAEIAEEIADVDIMLEQLRMIYDCAETCAMIKRQKLDRIEKRLRLNEL